jgi:hypothetical protein
MIMPNKNILIRYSLLNCGAIILTELGDYNTLSSLRERTKKCDALASYEKFILTLDYLYMIGAIALRDGMIVRCSNA